MMFAAGGRDPTLQYPIDQGEPPEKSASKPANQQPAAVAQRLVLSTAEDPASRASDAGPMVPRPRRLSR